jgi:alkylation response protein AidB-like acyl-CoA dehydrogenase
LPGAADHLLGGVGGGMPIMREMFNFERIILGGSALGVARSAFAIATAHAQRREAFGAMLGTKQLVWSDIAEMSWRIDAAELLTYRAAALYDAGTAPRCDVHDAIQAERITTLFAVPTQIQEMLHHPRFPDYDVSSLRMITTGGAAIAAAAMERVIRSSGRGASCSWIACRPIRAARC